MTSASPIEVRKLLFDALQIDLIGPSGANGDHHEVLPKAPIRLRWPDEIGNPMLNQLSSLFNVETDDYRPNRWPM